ncbi:tail fiber protein [Aeromonas phage ZPAH14]|uniref:Uncharacterized protein n=1 Tax=Aeromonas phage ZPAH14 TaxID=2924887 RepID=A0AAE9GZT0_9CAUD|nr:tail fiber protein [Aeromonas phage ZPAH14]UOT58052.1 hypothetical protein [Aeromonas phage ZPAH14]
MAKRPLLYDVWAQNALPEDIGDADVYVPQNPEYPDPQPNQYTVGWTVPGTMDVKQPHQWVNSWYQSIDYTLTMQRTGELGWDKDVQYRAGAIVAYGDKRYTALLFNINKQPDTNPTLWQESEFGMKSAAEVKLKLQHITATIDSHLNDTSDPHKVNWSNFFNGVGASAEQIDELISNATKNIDDHKADKNNPHGLTCAQVNVLEAAVGGTFTGAVSMLRMIRASGEAIKVQGPCFEMHAGGNSLGVKKGAACKDSEEAVAFKNYRAMKVRNNWRFPVPTPAIHLALGSGLHAYQSSGTGIEYLSTGTIEYTDKSGAVQTAAINEPAFGNLGLELRPDKGQQLNLAGAYTGTTGTVAGIVDDTMLLADVLLDKTNVLEYFPTGTAIRDIRIWNQPLTAYQRAALGFH